MKTVAASGAGAVESAMQALRAPATSQWHALQADGLVAPGQCVLLAASCSGVERAWVDCVQAGDFEAAWAQLSQAVSERWAGKSHALRWLRVELACNIRQTTWGQVCAQLAATKRNYWRQGIAFDAEFSRAILPLEASGNALLYDSRSPVATPNAHNLSIYAVRRFGQALAWPDDAGTPVWLFDTRAVFCDGADVHVIAHAGRHRGYRALPQFGPGVVGDVVVRATDYLARQVQPDGRYHYGVFPCFDRPIPTYNTLRHASATYALLEGWEVTGEPAHRDAIERALAHLCEVFIQPATLPDGTQAAFLVDVGNEVKLGGNAVSLLALCKHASLTGEQRWLPLMERLALGIVHMQQPDTGQFVHVLNWPSLSLKQAQRIIYYDGEAAFGLMRLFELTGDARWIQTVERAFTHFIAAEHWRAHDHWLGYCVDMLTRYRPQARYYRFGLDNVRDHLDFVAGRITTFPTLLELMMAARRMIRRLQADQDHAQLLDDFDLPRFDRALESRARYLMSGFFWPEVAMFFRNPVRVLDGFFIRHHGFRVRIDDVEHYLSGYVAYLADQTAQGRAHDGTGQRAPDGPALPADLAGQENGALEPALLTPIIGGRLHWRAAQAWEAMREAALVSGVVLESTHHVDTYRPLAVQERVFRARHIDTPVAGEAPVTWKGQRWWRHPGKPPCAVPGRSHHGWGLAVDVHRADQPARRRWLQANAARFGWGWTEAGEVWHLEYLAADAPPADVAAFVQAQALARQAGKGDGWTAVAVAQATGGTWVRAPGQADWRATGLCVWPPSMAPGQMVVVRGDDAPLGLHPVALPRLAHAPSALITQSPGLPGLAQEVPLLQVADRVQATLGLARHARARMTGRLVGVTGSAGKTTTVAMLADCLAAYGPTCRTQGNANLPLGVAWNLASMDWQARFGVLEMAVGRMGSSARLVQPDVAVVTNVTAAHLRYHGSVEEIARRKARIFSGMRPGSLAVLNRDLPEWRIFALQAARFGLRILHYGHDAAADLRLVEHSPQTGRVQASYREQVFEFVPGAPGAHMAMNALACLGAVLGLGLPPGAALDALARFQPLDGRGRVHALVLDDGRRIRLVDDAYNANPASMQAALRAVAESAVAVSGGRRVLALGDMLELEPQARALHEALAGPVRQAQPDLVLLCGPWMAHLAAQLSGHVALRWYPDATALGADLHRQLRTDDLVLFKSSAGTGLGTVVAQLRQAASDAMALPG